MGKTIEEYQAALEPEKQKIVGRLVSVVRECVPDADLAIKWGQPVFTTNGPFCFIKPAKSHVNLGFWWGAKITSGTELLEGTGEKMRHAKVSSVDDIDPEQLRPIIIEANRLNHELGDPTRTKA